jgi:hypothetical protein
VPKAHGQRQPLSSSAGQPHAARADKPIAGRRPFDIVCQRSTVDRLADRAVMVEADVSTKLPDTDSCWSQVYIQLPLVPVRGTRRSRSPPATKTAGCLPKPSSTPLPYS